MDFDSKVKLQEQLASPTPSKSKNTIFNNIMKDCVARDITLGRFLNYHHRIEACKFKDIRQADQEVMDEEYVLVEAPSTEGTNGMRELERYMEAVTCTKELERAAKIDK